MNQYFPDAKRNFEERTFNVNLISRIRRELDMIEQDLFLLEPDEKLEKIDKRILERQEPNCWNIYVDGNSERSMEVDFDRLLSVVEKEYNVDGETVSIWRFFVILEDMKMRAEQLKEMQNGR